MDIKKLSHLPKIDTTKLRAPKEPRKLAPCAKEMTAFLNCIKGDTAHDAINCKGMEVALSDCVRALQGTKFNKSQHKSTLTFHLQRFARQLGYKL